MAQYRQQSAFVGPPSTAHHHHLNGSDHLAIAVRPASHKQPRHHHRRSKSAFRRISFAAVVFFFCFILAAFLFLSSSHHSGADVDTSDAQDDDFKNDFLTNVTRLTTSQVQFGRGSVAHARDSRYWDGDDRRRDEDYNEGVMHKSNSTSEDNHRKGKFPSRGKSPIKHISKNNHHSWYNEAGRNELKMYEKKYEASLKNIGQFDVESDQGNHVPDDGNSDVENGESDVDDEYDNGIDSHNAYTISRVGDGGDNDVKAHDTHKVSVENSYQDSSSKSNKGDPDGQSKTGSDKHSKKHSKHHKSSSHCEMKLLNSTAQIVEPPESRKFARFSLSYIGKQVKPDGVDNWEPRFAGHQGLREREDAFLARDQKINCGFVKGPAEYSSTGFDLAEDDARFISKCHIAVISCIFGNSDRLRSPFGKAVSRLSRKNVCFVMFLDEATLQTLSSEGQMPDRMGFIGLWRLVVVKNLPYSDMRRVGKIPKLLSHRLFRSARYSIWLDSKLRLQRDPLLLLEYFLWRKGHEYAISNHYDRHCVWEEVERNKKLNKFNHTMIDQQFAFYLADGLKRFNASDPNKLLPSNVPEGSLIIRAHTPMSNLFSCLWFNEVDRFTPRDQLSFAYTYQKLRKKNPNKPFYLQMFKDCERRQIAKLFHHRTEEKPLLSQDVPL